MASELNLYNNGILIGYISELRRENQYVDVAQIMPEHILGIQSVIPKQNNPRLIAQQGAFLLFGFKDEISDKTATPIIPDKMYANYQAIKIGVDGNIIEKQRTDKKIQIIIKGSAKEEILNELKTLGISNSTMFPEIDNIANEIKNQYSREARLIS